MYRSYLFCCPQQREELVSFFAVWPPAPQLCHRTCLVKVLRMKVGQRTRIHLCGLRWLLDGVVISPAYIQPDTTVSAATLPQTETSYPLISSLPFISCYPINQSINQYPNYGNVLLWHQCTVVKTSARLICCYCRFHSFAVAELARCSR